MGIKDTIGVRRSKQQRKSIKSTPVSEGGLGLSPNKSSGSIDDAIRKAKENLLAQYWYDKYEKAASAIIKGEIRGDVADNFKELQEKVNDITEDVTLLEEEVTTSDPLTPLEKKFVTLDKLAEHYRLFINRVQKQIETISGGGAVQLSDLDDVDDSNRGHKSTLMYNDVTGKYEAADPDMNAGISNEDHSGDEIILNATDSSGTDEGGSIRQENKTATAVPSPTGDIVHTGVLQTTGNATISGTLGVGVDGDGRTDFNADVKFNGNTSGMLWDYSTNDLILYNNTRLEFGSNKDFEIWHGGTHTFMKNSGGDLRIRGDVIKLAREDSSEKYIECNVNSSVDLYFNGDQKFATTLVGVQVSGITSTAHVWSTGIATFRNGVNLLGLLHTNDDVNFTGENYNLSWDKSADALEFSDNAKLTFGAGTDLEIHSNGTNGVVGGAVSFTSDVTVGTSQAVGVVLTSPNGTKYRLVVANDGTLSTSAV